MSCVAYNTLRITGFKNEKERMDFKADVSKGKTAFSFENILPIEEGEDWGAWIYEHEEGEPGLCYVNTVEEFRIMNETGLLFHFRSHNGFPDHGIRNLSKLFPRLLITLHSWTDYGFDGFISFYNGKGNEKSIDWFDTEQEALLEVMIHAHSFGGYWWDHPDANYFGLLRLGLPEKCTIPEQDKEEVDDDTPL